MASKTSKWLGVAGMAMATFAAAGCGSSSDATPGSGLAFQQAKSEKAHDVNPAVADTDYQTFVSNTNDFGFDLYRKLAAEDGNLIYSPLSTATALAMTYAGAANNTDTQMAAVLHNTLPKDTFHAAFNKLTIDLASRNLAPHSTQEGTKSLQLSLVNAAWAQKDYQFVAQYLDTLAVNYDAGINILDFEQDSDGAIDTINGWVSDKTNSKITDLLAPGSLDSTTRLVLTNALYFYGSWASSFNNDSTQPAPFTLADSSTASVPTMNAEGGYGYYETADFQAVDLPYDGGSLAMTIVLPAPGKMADVRTAMTGAWLADLQTKMPVGATQVYLALPKFKFTWGTQSFKPALTALGMTDAFVSGVADFSGMEAKRELYISDVYHTAFIAIDESGTEAAAATAERWGCARKPQDLQSRSPVLAHDPRSDWRRALRRPDVRSSLKADCPTRLVSPAPYLEHPLISWRSLGETSPQGTELWE